MALSLSFPVSENCTLMSFLLRSLYEDCNNDYKYLGCIIVGRGIRKMSIHRLPLLLVLHLNWFEYTTMARKHQVFVDFPLQQLSLNEFLLYIDNSVLQNLSAVTNHYGTIGNGHCTFCCNLPQKDLWFECNDSIVAKIRSPVKTSAAYPLFYESTHSPPLAGGLRWYQWYILPYICLLYSETVRCPRFCCLRCLAELVPRVEAQPGWYMLVPWWTVASCVGSMVLSNISRIPSYPMLPINPFMTPSPL